MREYGWISAKDRGSRGTSMSHLKRVRACFKMGVCVSWNQLRRAFMCDAQ